jgi:hypothetical protein
MTNPSRSTWEDYAQQIAPLVASQDGAILLGLLNELRMAAASEAACDDLCAVSQARIGIWHADGSGWFRRKPGAEAAQRFALIEAIAENSAAPRVVLVGESVARGFFFDPSLTLADMVQSDLRHTFPDSEVVDLAATGQTIVESLTLIEQSIVLKPSAIVVYAGNNWIFEPLSYLDSVSIRRALVEGRYSDARAQRADVLRAVARQFFAVFARLLAKHRIPGLFVLPEFNLADHIDQACEFVPICLGHAPDEWMAARDTAYDALREGRMLDAERAAERMSALDGGSHPASHRVLGDCATHVGDSTAAYQHYARARDAVTTIPHLCTPRCPSAIQDEVRTCCRTLVDVTLVDLCETFLRVQSVPGRRLFMDYCHLTVEGLRLASRAIAGALVPAIGGSTVSSTALLSEASCHPSDEASAYFLAAVHNAQCSGSLDLSEDHCRTALAKWPGVANLMRDFVEFNTCGSPWWMCEAYYRVMQCSAAKRYFNARATTAGGNRAFLELVLRCIAEECPDHSHGQGSWAVRRTGPHDDTDALAFRRAFTVDRVLPDAAFVRSRSHRATFTVFAERPPRRASIVWRAAVHHPAEVCVTLNGVCCRHGLVSEEWTEAKFEFANDAGQVGKNEVAIQWPIGPPTQVACLDIDVYRGVMADPYHIFGELYRLTVS